MQEPAAIHQSPARPLVAIVEVARMLGVDVRHVRRLVAERRIPFIKWGHLLRFDPDELRAWLEGKRVEPARHTSPLR
jgi:excisionase family DNA binding protein